MAKKILVCDDAAFMRMMLKDILLKNDFEISGEASNGEEAILMYEKLRPDAVLMDITMPVMDGIIALENIIRKDPAANVIMMSAMGQQEQVVKSIQMGAKDYIIKPFRADFIVNALRKVLK